MENPSQSDVKRLLAQCAVDHPMAKLGQINAFYVDNMAILPVRVRTGQAMRVEQNEKAFGAGAFTGMVTDNVTNDGKCVCGRCVETDNDSDLAAFNVESLFGYGIWDGGASKSVGGYTSLQEVVDNCNKDDVIVSQPNVSFTFAGGEGADAGTKVTVKHDILTDGVPVHCIPNENTPILLGLDLIRHYGLVLDYHNDTVFSHKLNRYVPAVVLPSGHLALRMTIE